MVAEAVQGRQSVLGARLDLPSRLRGHGLRLVDCPTYMPDVYFAGMPRRFPPDLAECTGFEWDAGNSEKNWRKHRVRREEAEQIFSNRPLLMTLATDEDSYPAGELRDLALGRTDVDRWLFVVFTIRGELIRIISVRDMTRSERRHYEEAIQTDEA
jgi:hypothetical protein